MENRFFWEKKTLKKFKVIFETNEIIVGADRKRKHRTFRKDTGLIAFSRREVLEMRFADLTKKQHLEAEGNENKRISLVRNPALGFNFS